MRTNEGSDTRGVKGAWFELASGAIVGALGWVVSPAIVILAWKALGVTSDSGILWDIGIGASIVLFWLPGASYVVSGCIRKKAQLAYRIFGIVAGLALPFVAALVYFVIHGLPVYG